MATQKQPIKPHVITREAYHANEGVISYKLIFYHSFKTFTVLKFETINSESVTVFEWISLGFINILIVYES